MELQSRRDFFRNGIKRVLRKYNSFWKCVYQK